MIEMALKDVEKYYGANHILKGVTFDVKQDERIGLLGPNGSGKSTLFRIMAGLEPCDGGSRAVRKGAQVGMLEQLPRYPEGYTAYDVLYTSFEEVHTVHGTMKELEKLLDGGAYSEELLEKYGRLQERFELLGGYAVEDNIARVCTGLKIDGALSSTPFNSLSGGEQTRVMLGVVILRRPDILLLDEPTNHLDIDSLEWLEGYLSAYKGAAVIISHDRYFLDRTVGRIVELSDGRAELYEGGYSWYRQEKESRYQARLEQFEQEQKKLRQLEAAAKRMHEWAKMADNPAMHKRAFSIEKRIERMDRTEKPRTVRALEGEFSEYGFSGKDVVNAKQVVKAYMGKTVLDHTDFTVRKGERVAVLGNNGSGKTTLFRCITGEEAVDSGKLRIGESIRYAYLPQVVSFEKPGLSMLDTVRELLLLSEGNARKLLAGYHFRNEDVNKSVGSLSGGEKSRLRLCILMQGEVNLLLLDEPTNHLDIDSREWLEAALEEFGGTIVFISHDRYFINRFATRVSLLEKGRITDYYGDYEYFRNIVRQQDARAAGERTEAGKEPEPRPDAGTAGKPEKSGAGRAAGRPAALESREKDDRAARASRLESMIAGVEQELKEIAKAMLDRPDDPVRLEELSREQAGAEQRLELLYREWGETL